MSGSEIPFRAGRRPASWLHLPLVLWIAAGCLQCGGDLEPEPHAAAPPRARDAGQVDPGRHDEDFVELSGAEAEEFEVRVALAGPASIERGVELPGVVRPNGDRLAHIVPRFAGIVTQVRKRVGDPVKSGETLAVIESSRSLTPYALKTLIGGVIIEKHVTRGEAVTSESQAFIVADLSTVWVDLSVYQRDIDSVAVGQVARVVAGHDLPEAEGHVSYVTPTVDPDTRTATARVVLDNASGFWRPGMFVTSLIMVDRAEAPVAVPLTAIQTLPGRNVVFTAVENGFRARTVQLGRRDERNVEVSEGLAAGDRVVVEGGFTLKAEMLRGEFAGGHEH